jgi:hypothetical protein
VSNGLCLLIMIVELLRTRKNSKKQ